VVGAWGTVWLTTRGPGNSAQASINDFAPQGRVLVRTTGPRVHARMCSTVVIIAEGSARHVGSVVSRVTTNLTTAKINS